MDSPVHGEPNDESYILVETVIVSNSCLLKHL